jgi:hypothetical protein
MMNRHDMELDIDLLCNLHDCGASCTLHMLQKACHGTPFRMQRPSARIQGRAIGPAPLHPDKQSYDHTQD